MRLLEIWIELTCVLVGIPYGVNQGEISLHFVIL